MNAAHADEEVLPLHAEGLVVTRRAIPTLVRAERVTTTRTEDLAITLSRDTVVVDRMKRGTFVEAVPPIREEGEFIVIPVVDEVLITERRLVLTEEIRLRRVRTQRTHAEHAVLRTQHVVVTRRRNPEHEGNPPMSTETIVALFDTPAHAELALQDLLASGVPASAVERHEASSTDAPDDASMMSTTTRRSFWSRLFGAEPEHHGSVYDRSLESGATVLTVRPAAERIDDIVTILEGHHPVDMDEREAEYSAASVAGPTTGPAASIAADGLSDSRRIDTDLPVGATAGSAGTSAGMGAGIGVGGAGRTGDERVGDRGEVLTLSAEALAVGKRVVNRGGTRVRRFVVETPVEETVSLHGERVAVERRAVDGIRAAEPGSFSERAIEMIETDEVAVVRKDARVVEEVVLRKEATERTETVRDTVRHEDVAVERIADGTPGPR